MEWYEAFDADSQPNDRQIMDFIHNPMWSSINNYLHRAYMSEPKYSYSGCSMQQGWNSKYSKGAKWLMLDIKSRKTLLDALKLIALRVKPKNKIEREN